MEARRRYIGKRGTTDCANHGEQWGVKRAGCASLRGKEGAVYMPRINGPGFHFSLFFIFLYSCLFCSEETWEDKKRDCMISPGSKKNRADRNNRKSIQPFSSFFLSSQRLFYLCTRARAIVKEFIRVRKERNWGGGREVDLSNCAALNSKTFFRNPSVQTEHPRGKDKDELRKTTLIARSCRCGLFSCRLQYIL